MSLYILDTDHVSLHQRKHSQVTARIENCPAEELAITAVTIGEQMRGRLAQLGRPKVDLSLAYDLLSTTAEYFCTTNILPFDAVAQHEYQNLRSQKIRVGKIDLRIAAIALSRNAVLVTRNRRDFEQVPGLTIEDWSQ